MPPGPAFSAFAVTGLATGVTPACYASMRENSPPHAAALSVAVLLTASDLAAAGTQYLAGHLLTGSSAHPAAGFQALWWLLLGWACIWVLGAALTRETRAENRWAGATVAEPSAAAR